MYMHRDSLPIVLIHLYTNSYVTLFCFSTGSGQLHSYPGAGDLPSRTERTFDGKTTSQVSNMVCGLNCPLKYTRYLAI